MRLLVRLTRRGTYSLTAVRTVDDAAACERFNKQRSYWQQRNNLNGMFTEISMFTNLTV